MMARLRYVDIIEVYLQLQTPPTHTKGNKTKGKNRVGEAHVTDCGAAGLQGKVRAEDAVEIVMMRSRRGYSGK